MNNKEAIINSTIALIKEKGERMHEITVREICKKANVGIGLINYHFGNKDKLIELCVEYIVNGIVENFQSIQEKAKEMPPFERLEYLGNMTIDFLFEHYTVSRVSVLTDIHTPKDGDNTNRTYLAYLPLVSACRPDWEAETVKRKTFCLIVTMQQAFIRHKQILQTQGIDLTDKKSRRQFHSQMLHDILEV